MIHLFLDDDGRPHVTKTTTGRQLSIHPTHIKATLNGYVFVDPQHPEHNAYISMSSHSLALLCLDACHCAATSGATGLHAARQLTHHIQDARPPQCSPSAYP